MAARKRKVTKQKKARAAAKKKTTKTKTKTTKTTASKKRRVKTARRAVAKVDPDATIQVPVAEVLGDIEETMALDRLREDR